MVSNEEKVTKKQMEVFKANLMIEQLEKRIQDNEKEIARLRQLHKLNESVAKLPE